VTVPFVSAIYVLLILEVESFYFVNPNSYLRLCRRFFFAVAPKTCTSLVGDSGSQYLVSFIFLHYQSRPYLHLHLFLYLHFVPIYLYISPSPLFLEGTSNNISFYFTLDFNFIIQLYQ
jgi:hypothetical protein